MTMKNFKLSWSSWPSLNLGPAGDEAAVKTLYIWSFDGSIQGNEFADTFRMTRNSFEQLHALLGTTLFHPCFLLMNRTLYYLTRHQLPSGNSSKIRLLAFLQHVAQGTNYRTISNHFGIGRATVSRCVHDVSCAILTHMWRVYICLPTPAETAYNMHAWAHQTGIPGVVAL